MLKATLKFIGGTLFAICLLLLLAGAAALAPFAYYARTVEASDIGSKESIMNRYNTGLILLDRNGDVFYRFYQGRRIDPVPAHEIPEHTRNAIISAEDKDFYTNPGYSVKSMAAAAIANARNQSLDYGASTITQQLVKNSFLTNDKTWARKYQEIVLATKITNTYSKDEILEMYVNSVYFGSGAFGIADASATYFGKSVQELTIAESAMLAGILVAPSVYSPIGGDELKARQRQVTVLRNMQEEGLITAEERSAAEEEELVYVDQADKTQYEAPAFALLVRQQLIEEYGEEQIARSGFVVHTTLDLDWQRKAQQAVADQVAKLAPNNVSNGAAVVMEPKTGEVRAIVGSKNWEEPGYGKVNVATSLRQPGSSFKPIVYLGAFEKEVLSPSSVLHDVPTTFGKDYKPKNYDGRFRGNVTVRKALATSLNVPAVEAQQIAGVPQTLDLASRLGISSLGRFSKNDLSVSLGSGETTLLEMTGAYATVANGGRRNAPTLVTAIHDKTNARIYEHVPEQQQVVGERYTYLLSNILSDNAARKEVFGDALTLDRPAAAKTGTSQDYRDSWTIGYTPSLAIGVWVGNNDGSPMNAVAGALGAAPIWKTLMGTYLAGTPKEEFSRPGDILEIRICRSSGLRVEGPWSGNDTSLELFAQGTEPKKVCVAPTPEPTPAPTPDAIVEDLTAVGGESEIIPLPTLEPTPEPTSEPTPPPTPDGDLGDNRGRGRGRD